MMRRLTLLVALASGAMATAALADRAVTHTFDSTTPLHGARRIVVDIPAGEFHIQNGASDTIGLHGAVRRDYDSYKDREQHQIVVNDISLEVIVKGDEVIIRCRFGSNAHGWS